jgi:carotenoid cleavage dioxygenase-like enzyme
VARRHARPQRTGDVDATGLVRIDVTDGTETGWRERDCFAGESVFVSRNQQSEDGHDGVGRDEGGERDEEFEERARACLPHALPLGFHGEYFE